MPNVAKYAHANSGILKAENESGGYNNSNEATIPVVRIARKMRGGSQSWLVEGADGFHYVAKFRNNPQGSRTLANEWISHRILRHLGIATPIIRRLKFGSELISANPDLVMHFGDRAARVEAGTHLGSMFPGDPAETAVYDFLPDRMLRDVANLQDFLGTLVVDRWVSNVDVRQAVFFRGKPRVWAPCVAAHGSKRALIALMIDHGLSFGGARWEFSDAPSSGIFGNPIVYKATASKACVRGWVERVLYFPERVIEDALSEVPDEWIDGERGELESLGEKLLTRRKAVAQSVDRALSGVFARP